MPSSSQCSQCHCFLLVSAHFWFKREGKERPPMKDTYCHKRMYNMSENEQQTGHFPSMAISLDCLLKLHSQIATVSVVLVTFGNSISVFWGYIDFLWLPCSDLVSYWTRATKWAVSLTAGDWEIFLGQQARTWGGTGSSEKNIHATLYTSRGLTLAFDLSEDLFVSQQHCLACLSSSVYQSSKGSSVYNNPNRCL